MVKATADQAKRFSFELRHGVRFHDGKELTSADVRATFERYRKVSGRNQLVGKVVDLKIDGLMAKVVLAIGDQRITSVITSDAVREMQLKRGDTAAALVKSTDVMIELL